MDILKRFFGKGDAKERLAASESTKEFRALQLLFAGNLRLDPNAVAHSLRSYHPSMASATCEIDADTSAQGTPLGLLGWGKHVVRFVGFDNPMPTEVVEKCLQPAHFGQDLKAQARAHKAHLLLDYAGRDGDSLNQYVALAAAAGVLSAHGAIVVLNESGHTAFPCLALAKDDGDMMELLESLPIPILYSGFVKFDVQGVEGTWMRTRGNHLLGLPDFALLARGHHEGQMTFDMFCDLLSYLRSSGATFAPGHTTQIGEDVFLKIRSQKKEEYFLDSPGTMLVLEPISRNQINQARA